MRRRVLLSLLVVLAAAGVAVWLHHLAASYDRPYDLIEPDLYLGAAVDAPPPGTKAVVNLCGRRDPYPADATLHLPVLEGGDEPDLAWLRRVTAFIGENRRAGRAVYVHCLAGMNRSATAVTAYLMAEHGWGRDEALAFVKSRRDAAQPNPTLMRLLAEWEKELTEGR